MCCEDLKDEYCRFNEVVEFLKIGSGDLTRYISILGIPVSMDIQNVTGSYYFDIDTDDEDNPEVIHVGDGPYSGVIQLSTGYSANLDFYINRKQMQRFDIPEGTYGSADYLIVRYQDPSTLMSGYNLLLACKDIEKLNSAIQRNAGNLPVVEIIEGTFNKVSDITLQDCIDQNHPNYSVKLAAAIEAWSAINEDPTLCSKQSPKTAIKKWLEENKSRFIDSSGNGLSKQAIEDISKVVNWNTKGGAPKSL